MGYINEKLWHIFLDKVREEDKNLEKECQIGNEYITAVKTICKYGVERADTIRDNFPMYTLHNEVHICNIMRLMLNLLGDEFEKLTRDETAMLIMAACCHDIGMSYSDQEKEELFNDEDRLNEYLDKNHGEYVKAYSSGGTSPMMTEDMIQNYLRTIHHERVMELLFDIEWPAVLEGKVDREDLIRVCQSHGKDITSLDDMDETATVDLRFCAILLRMADILDFDTSRAPETLYRYSGFQTAYDDNALKSKGEWDKHFASHGFDFVHIKERSYIYTLDFNANCKSMQVEQMVNCYLDWVDQELNFCGKQLRRFMGKWQKFILPGKIKRNIKSEGYVSGQYRFSVEQEKVIELLIGNELYSDPSVFVRELIQNAIDAVRTREQLDKNLPSGWKGQINIRCWMDAEGYHWFRIEDNGIGMTEDIIMNYFLKIGSSYYSSDTFSKSKLKCKADPDYMPISRFGIGILSCFMGDKQTNQVEISTKHFKEGESYNSALRLSMHGINGYYYLASKNKKHMPGPMKGVTKKEQEQFLTQPGTAIAVRTNLYQTGKYRGFKEIISKYVIYPPVSIHYDGEEGSCDYPTETEFMNSIHLIEKSDNLEDNGVIEFTIPNDELNILTKDRPEISFKKNPKLILKCIPLDYYTCIPYLKGAVLTAKVEGEHNNIVLKIGRKKVRANVEVEPGINKEKDRLSIRICLRFENDFEREMDVLEQNYFHRRRAFRDCYKRILSKYSNYVCIEEIIMGIEREVVDEKKWRNYIVRHYEISEEKLTNILDEIEGVVTQYSGISKIEKSDIKGLKLFDEMKKEWSYEVCSLSEFEWYVKYFKRIKDDTGMYSIVAHNGIACGSAEFFFRESYMKKNLGTIILLKDKYRPYLDVARDGVKGLTLENASEFEIIKKKIGEHGFDVDGDLSLLNDGNYSYIAMKDYCELLKDRSDLKKQLMFNTDKGLISNSVLRDNLLNHGMVCYNSIPTLSNSSVWSKNDDLYEYLCAAFLRENYTLKVEFLSYNTKIFISKKEKDLPEEYKKLFPACFFLPTINGDETVLTTEYMDGRRACNEYHVLSKFIINNGEKLKQYVPGVFKELLRILAEEDGDKLVEGVNIMLEHLRKLPGGLFDISEHLFISKNDLC